MFFSSIDSLKPEFTPASGYKKPPVRIHLAEIRRLLKFIFYKISNAYFRQAPPPD